MAQINLQIPDAQLQRVIAALCDGLMTPTGSPVDPTPALAKQALIQIIKVRVLQYEENKARAAIPPPDVTDVVA